MITKAPNYTRLLVVLPFVGYFAGIPLWWIAELFTKRLSESLRPSRNDIRTVVAGVLTAVIVVCNRRNLRRLRPYS